MILNYLDPAGIAQLVEQRFCNPQVPCSIHGAGTIPSRDNYIIMNRVTVYSDCCGVAQLVEQLTVNQLVAGSSPAAAATSRSTIK